MCHAAVLPLRGRVGGYRSLPVVRGLTVGRACGLHEHEACQLDGIVSAEDAHHQRLS